MRKQVANTRNATPQRRISQFLKHHLHKSQTQRMLHFSIESQQISI